MDISALITDGIYEQKLLDALQQRIQDGLAWYKKESAYLSEPAVLRCVEGEWKGVASKALSRLYDNQLRKIEYEIASSLTDVRPIWSYATSRVDYKEQADIFSKLARFWWRKSHSDRPLFSAIVHSEKAGAGYLWQRWNPYLPGGGDLELVALGPRDVLPIGPVYSESIQDWQGVVIRQTVDMADLIHQYPTKRGKISSSTGGWFDPPARMLTGSSKVITPMEMLTRSVAPSGGPTPSRTQLGTCDLMIAYFKDHARNTSGEPKQMGQAGSNWEYTVAPGDPLYPRGRMVKFVQNCILEDGPNPYWHGQIPLTRVMLLPEPETLLGLSLLADLIPLNDKLNEVLRCLDDGLQQWTRRGVKTNSAMAESKLKALDPRQAGLKVRVNMTAGEDFSLIDGPKFPEWIMAYAEYLKNAMAENSGARGLRQLDQLKQMPSGDTLEKYMESLSPLVATMARSIEITLSEVADQFIMNVMQFYSTARRFQTLGPQGVMLEDFDFDPGNIVPKPLEGDTESPAERAIEHKKNFMFDVQANSFLKVSNSTKQLQVLQLYQRNVVDPWTLWDAFDMQGIGPWPAETIAERMGKAKELGIMMGPPPELVGAQLQAQLLQTQAMIIQMQGQIAMMTGQAGGPPPGGPGGPPPQGGPPPAPAGAPGPGPGRPGSGQEPPQLIQRSDGEGGQRMVLSESGG